VKDREFLILPRQLSAGLRHAVIPLSLAYRMVFKKYIRHFRTPAMTVGN